jgi:hypothetical protein
MKWQQTPEGRKRISAMMKKRHADGVFRRAKHWSQRPEGRARLAEIKAARAAAKGAPINGHASPSAAAIIREPTGRAMLVALARQGAELRRIVLLKELQTLDLFLAKTGPKK